MDLSLKNYMMESNEDDLEYYPYTWDIEVTDYAFWKRGDMAEISYLIHEAKSQGYDIIRFGKEILWESNKWLDIKRGRHGES